MEQQEETPEEGVSQKKPRRRVQGSRCCEPPPASDSQEQPSLSHQSPSPRSCLPYLSSTLTSLKSLGKNKDSLGHAFGGRGGGGEGWRVG